jgi:hypothetical protein
LYAEEPVDIYLFRAQRDAELWYAEVTRHSGKQAEMYFKIFRNASVFKKYIWKNVKSISIYA